MRLTNESVGTKGKRKQKTPNEKITTEGTGKAERKKNLYGKGREMTTSGLSKE